MDRLPEGLSPKGFHFQNRVFPHAVETMENCFGPAFAPLRNKPERGEGFLYPNAGKPLPDGEKIIDGSFVRHPCCYLLRRALLRRSATGRHSSGGCTGHPSPIPPGACGETTGLSWQNPPVRAQVSSPGNEAPTSQNQLFHVFHMPYYYY